MSQAVTLADDIRVAWAWFGVEPAEVLCVNKFGNVVFTDKSGKYWRICPEELQCKCIADSAGEYERLARDTEFAVDWEMARLVALAESKFGVQPSGRCFCLKIPAMLGGEYDIGNIGTISVGELVRFSGDVARQIKDLPPGSKVELKVVD